MTTTTARVRLLAATVLATGLVAAAPAWARCVTNPAGAVTCDTTAPNPETAQQTARNITVNPNAAIVSASNPAINETAFNGFAIVNSGTISSSAAGGRAINVSGVSNGGSILLTNNAGGLITSQDDAFRINVAVTGNVLVNNSGTISTINGGQALDFDAAGNAGAGIVINNFTGGVLSSVNQDGIRPGQGALVTNAGLIRSDYNGAYGNYDGVDLQANTATINNQAGGTISGARHGITSDTGLTVTNAGTIIGRNGSGVGSDGNGTVTNLIGGTITGQWDGVQANGDGDGVDIDFIANVVNSGTIQGLSAVGVDSGGRPNSAEGVAIGGGTVTNNVGGTIVGAGTGILVNHDTNPGGIADAAATITNAGTIRGGAGRAITLVGPFGDTITNTGTIIGGAQGAIDTGDGNDLLTNSGTITGNVSLGNGDDTLALLPGSAITGTVDGGAGSDRITLGGASNGDFAGAANFERLDVTGGSWTLTGAPNVAAATIAAGATLIASTPLLGGAIADAGTLRVDQATDGAFTAALSGTGSLIKAGTGTVTIASSPSFTGATTVAAGRLLVTGALPSAVGVASGGTLGGTGALASATIAAGGTIAPGTSGVGTLTVVGNFTQAAGSSYAADIAGALSDRLVVGGTATLAGGAALAVTGSAGTAPVGTRYTFLTATGGITGGYTLSQTTGGPTELRLGQNGNAVYADLVRSASGLTALAVTPNQRAAAGAVAAFGTASPIYSLLTANPDAAVAPAAFDLLSGEIHASLRTAAVRDIELVQGAAMARARDRATGTGLWGTFIGDDGQDDGTKDGTGSGALARQRRTTLGGAGGVDAVRGDVRFGIAGGYTRDDVALDSRRSFARLEGKHVLGYAGGAFNRLTLDAAIGYSWVDADTDRAVAFTGFADRLRADYQTRVLHTVADIGYAIPLGGGSVEPFASGAIYRVTSDSFTESGGPAALRGIATTERFALGYLGIRGSTPIVDGLSAKVSGAWRHGFGVDDRTPGATLAFANGSVPFSVAGAPLSRDAVTASLDLAYTPTDRLRVFVGYQGIIARQTEDNGVRAGLSIGF